MRSPLLALLLALTLGAASPVAAEPLVTLAPPTPEILAWQADLGDAGTERGELVLSLWPRDAVRGFAGGCLRLAVGPLRSVGLVSSDGGLSWRETLPSLAAHDLVAVRWSGTDRCLAALQWAVEGPGWQVRLFASADAGETWRELAPVKKDSYLDHLSGLAFDGRVGVVTFEPFDEGAPEGTKPPYALATTDEGSSWHRTPLPRMLPRPLPLTIPDWSLPRKASYP